jgi:hypothetical protein
MAAKLKPLPFKRPSSLLLAAVEDLKKARRKYRINMNVWVVDAGQPISRDTTRCAEACSVCMAGSTLVERCRLDTKGVCFNQSYDCNGDDMPWQLWCQLRAINFFRIGKIGRALDTLRKPLPAGLPNWVDTPGWEDTPNGRRKFYASMMSIVKLLRKHGL